MFGPPQNFSGRQRSDRVPENTKIFLKNRLEMFQNINPNDVLNIFCLRELRSLEDETMTSLEISSENSEIKL